MLSFALHNFQQREWAPDKLWLKLLIPEEKEVLKIIWHTSQHQVYTKIYLCKLIQLW